MALYRTLPKISPELIFVLSCTRYTETDKETFRTLLSPTIDWDLVLHLSLAHGLFPLVYNALKGLDNPTVPEYVIKTLRQHYLINALKVMGQTNEIVRIIKTMDEYGLQPLILKGSPLSVKINEDIAFRPSNDIDMLVNPLDFDRAEQIIEQMGYKRYSPDFVLTPRQQKAYFGTHHHFEYFHLKRAISVELHWRIRSFNVKNFPLTSKLSTQMINVEECLVPVMDDEYWLLFLMVHGYKHFWARLRWLYDIKEFMKLKIDWDKLIYQADISELRPILHQSLILANQLFNVPIPDCLEQSVANDRKAWQLAYTVMDKLSINIRVNNLPNFKFPPLRDGALSSFNYFNLKWKNKLYFLFFIFRPSEKEFQLISLPDFLYPFYYLIKPPYWLWRQIIKIPKKFTSPHKNQHTN